MAKTGKKKAQVQVAPKAKEKNGAAVVHLYAVPDHQNDLARVLHFLQTSFTVTEVKKSAKGGLLRARILGAKTK